MIKLTELNLKDIEGVLSGYAYQFVGNESIASFNNAKSIDDADSNSISWISPKNTNGINLIKKTAARLIICKSSMEIPDELQRKKCFIFTENPKLVFSVIVSELLQKKISGGIHPSAIIHPEAELSDDIYVGPFTYVGKSKIGSGAIIWGHCYLYDGVTIGNNVEIHAGCILGADGSGFSKNEKGQWIKFPHIGGTIIEDDVEIGANTYINKGSLGNTIIKRGVKIGSAVCIGHNVLVEEDSIVLANSLIAGSTKVGKNVYIAPSAVIKNKLTIGTNATVGMGAVVLKNVPENTTVIGNPAITLKEYSKWTRLKASA